MSKGSNVSDKTAKEYRCSKRGAGSMKIDKCGRPKTQKIKPRYICFIWLISLFSFYKLRNLDRDILQYFDFIQRSLVKTWKGDHINIAWILVLKTENDVEFLQSAKKKKKLATHQSSIYLKYYHKQHS